MFNLGVLNIIFFFVIFKWIINVLESSSEGCNLRVLQEWAWKRVHHIKTSVDRQCRCSVL